MAAAAAEICGAVLASAVCSDSRNQGSTLDPDTHSHAGAVMEGTSMAEPMNANTSSGAANGQDASARISKALQYKAAKAAAQAAPPHEQPAPIADDITGAAELKQMLLRMQSNGEAGKRSLKSCALISCLIVYALPFFNPTSWGERLRFAWIRTIPARSP